MLTRRASFRRLTACCAALVACFTLAITSGQPLARAADGRDLLANAIGSTRGSYLVYNFGPGHPAPMLNAGGSWYEMNNGGHLMIIKNATGRLSPHLLVDTHQGDQARCENNPGARTGEGLWQASELYAPLQAWQRMGQPTIAINANFFDVRGQKGGSWRQTGCSSPLGAFVDNTQGQGRANQAVTGTVFWLVAARLDRAADVGLATALFASLQFVNYLSALGLQELVGRFTPLAEREADQILAWSVLVTVASSAVATVGYLSLAAGGEALDSLGLNFFNEL